MAHTVVNDIKKAQKLINSGSLDKAESLCIRILKREPRQPDTLHLLGLIDLRSGRHDRAVQIYNKLLQIRPQHAIYHYNLGLAHQHLLQFDLAAQHLQQATKLDPNLAQAYSDLCLVLRKIGDIEKAIKAGMNAVRLLPEDPAANYNLGIAYDAWRDFDAALKYYKIAAQMQPEHAEIQFALGNTYSGRGDIDTARQCYRKVIKLNPKKLESVRHLVGMTKYTSPDHEDVVQINSILEQDWLTDDDRSELFFALGKIYEDCGLYDAAFSFLERGNRLQDRKLQFDPDKLAQYVSALVDFFTREFIVEKRMLGNPSETPIFVVGTPRSGTTLVEQIISSHSRVFGAGELDWFERMESALPEYLETAAPYPECLDLLTKDSVDELTAKYLRYIHSLASGERRITDKMPGNFLKLGLIHIFFPHARIIHCRREPRDACISMFQQYFPGSVGYSYDLFKLGAYYAQYLRIMDHWCSVLPSGTLIEVEYELLVRDQALESRRLVEFLGLEWEEACLAFYKSDRRINTASHLQVKKPMYSSSIGRWKHYQEHLLPLEEGFRYRQ